MRQLAEAFERRAHRRVRERLPCKLLIGGHCHPGTVRDFSTRGFFVESGAELPLGAAVVVAFSTAGGERFVLEAFVPHRKSASRSLVGLMQAGVGLRLDYPPQAYVDWAGASHRNDSGGPKPAHMDR